MDDDETDDDRVARLAAERARVEAFLAALSVLCNDHGMYIDGWARYADDAFFGVEVDSRAVTKYTIDDTRGGGSYEVKRD